MENVKLYMESMVDYIKCDVMDCSLLEKPIIHCAVELCATTTTLFGHWKLVSEIVFELAHRRFKAWLETNRHDVKHITGMEIEIDLDWSCRVLSQYNLWCDGGKSHKLQASLGLTRLLFGV